MAERDSSEPKPTGPSREEIIERLNEHKGTVYVWSTLTAKYGSAKNTWGSFCRLVIREHKASSNASNATSVNGPTNAPANAQSNAPSNAAPSNSGSKTAIVTEHSTPNVPMVIVREPDAIIQRHDQLPANTLPDAMDMVNFQLFVNDPRFQQLMQSRRTQYQAASVQSQPVPRQNSVQDISTLMLQMMQIQPLIQLYRVIMHGLFGV